MGSTIEGNTPSLNANQYGNIHYRTSSAAKDKSTTPKGGGISEKGGVSFSPEARSTLNPATEKRFTSEARKDPGIQQLKNNFSPGAIKAYEGLTKGEKSRLKNTLNGTTTKKGKLTDIEIDNRKSFISGHPYVTKGLGPLNGEQSSLNTFDEKQKEYDNLSREGKITRDEHARRTEMNRRFKEMSPEQRKSFMEMMRLDSSL
ncbi:MAG: hypothetical protein RDV48_24240 [Candidatus Eremiobacteraeota bacterium]|nr:hypothetical protein [Candidatus Eremiobacteraeota bacterium]